MRIKMLHTRRGTEDGFTIRQYHEGEEYDVHDHLACAFIAGGHAEPVRKGFGSRKTEMVKEHSPSVEQPQQEELF